jgi:hypothetical protein
LRLSPSRPSVGITTRFLSVLCLAIATLACGPGPSPSPRGSPATSPLSTASATTVSVSPSPSGAPASGAVAIDPTLLSIVPPTVDGVAITPDAETAAQIAAEEALADDVDSLAVGLAVAPGTSAADNLAIVNVVKLRDGVFGEGFFRGWRDSYDEAACAPAGGVAGHAEAELDGRLVYIGTCTGGAITYHVALEADGIVVAVTSVGVRRFGEQIVSNLTP